MSRLQSSGTRRRMFPLLVLAVAVLALACGSADGSEQRSASGAVTTQTPSAAVGSQFHSVAYDVGRAAPLLRLERDDGSVYDLAEQQGRVVVVFFGYAECTYICPLTIPNFAAVLRSMAPVHQDAIDFVMVTVDPEHETPEDVQRFVARYDERFIGLGGTPGMVEAVMERWRVRREIESVGTDVSPSAYSIGHSSYMLVVDGKGDLRLKVPQQLTAAEIVQDLQTLLEED